MKLRIYMNGVGGKSEWDLDDVFNYGVRFQILTQTEEERDYLIGLQLIYGRQVDIHTWNQWKNEVRALWEIHPMVMPIRLLPVVFTTYDAGNSLRGM